MEKKITDWKLNDIAIKIVDDIINDLLGRKGLADEWEEIDWDIQEEITDKWIEIVEKRLSIEDE